MYTYSSLKNRHMAVHGSFFGVALFRGRKRVFCTMLHQEELYKLRHL